MKIGGTYFPDAQLNYAPEPLVTAGLSTPFERVVIYLPATPPPKGGYPLLCFTGFGGFASILAFNGPIAEPPPGGNPTFWKLFLALEAGIAIAIWGLPGSDTHRYAPGGDLYEGGSGASDLPAPIPGRGTFDQYGATLEFLDHHPSPAQGDGAGLEFRTPLRCGAWCVQKLRSVAGIYKLDLSLSVADGRSAGAQVALGMTYMPEQQDATAEDHRKYSSLLAAVRVSVPFTWFPLFKRNAVSDAGKYFPRVYQVGGGGAVDNELALTQVANRMDEAPLIWPREASVLRYAVRNWATVGGPTGEAMRSQAGKVPFYIQALDDDFGLESATVTEALTFVGSDSNDNRIPAILEDTTNVHPPICALMHAARMREIEPFEGFHAQRSRVYISDHHLPLLTGQTVGPGGAPAASLVTGAIQSVTDPVTGGALDVVAWMLETFDFLKPGWNSAPPPLPLPEQAGVDVLLRIGAQADAVLGERDLLHDPGLVTAVLVSLFTDRRLPADMPASDDFGRRGSWSESLEDPEGSLLWTLTREKRVPETLRRAELYVREALAWMVEDQILERVSARAVYEGELMVLRVDLVRGRATRWDHLWQGTLDGSYDLGSMRVQIAVLQ